MAGTDSTIRTKLIVDTSDVQRAAQRVQQGFSKMGQAGAQTGKQVNASMQQAARGMSANVEQMNASMSRGVQKIGAGVQQAVGGVKSAVAEMAKQAVGITAMMAGGQMIMGMNAQVGEFNKQMRTVATISDDVSQNMEQYKQQVIDLCKQLPIAPEEAAAALYQINSASFLGADGLKVLEASAKGAVGGVTETATAADAITTILNGYGLSADHATEISDKLFMTVKLGKTTMDELGRSIAFAAPQAAAFGISIDEVLTIVAQLTKQGNSTQNAMTQLSATITSLGNAYGDDAFKQGLIPALDRAMQDANGSNQALKESLGNIRAVRGALGVTGDKAADTQATLQQIQSSAGATEAAVSTMTTDAIKQQQELKMAFFDAWRGVAAGAVSSIGVIAGALNGVFGQDGLKNVVSTVTKLVVVWGVYKVAMAAVCLVQKAYNGIIERSKLQMALAKAEGVALTRVQALQAAATSACGRAWKGLTAAMASNAVGLAVAAISAAIVAFVSHIQSLNEAEEEARQKALEAKAAYEEWKRSIADLEGASQEYSAKELGNLKSLYNAMMDEKSARDKRLEAAKQLQQMYPSVFGALSKEAMLAGQAAEAYTKLAQAIMLKARAEAAKNLIVKNEERRMLLEQEKERRGRQTAYQEGKLTQGTSFYTVGQKSFADNGLGQNRQFDGKGTGRINEVKKKGDKYYVYYYDSKGQYIEQEAENQARAAKIYENKEYNAAATRQIADINAANAKLMDDALKAQVDYNKLGIDATPQEVEYGPSKKQRKEQEKAEKEAAKQSKGSGAGAANNAKRTRQEAERLDKEELALQTDTRRELLELDRDSADKTIAIAEIERDERVRTLQDKARDWAEKNKETGRKGADQSAKLGEKDYGGLTAGQVKALEDAADAANKKVEAVTNDIYRAEAEGMQELLKSQNAFQMQRLGIEQEYNARIAAAQTEGERLRLEQEKKTAMAQATAEGLDQKINVGEALMATGGMLTDALGPIIDELEKFKRSAEYAALPAEQQAQVTAEITRFKEAANPSSLNEAFANTAEASDNLKASQAELGRQTEALAAAQAAYEEALKKATFKDENGQEYVDDQDAGLQQAQADMLAANENYNRAVSDNAMAVQNNTDAVGLAQERMNDFANALNGLNSGSLAGVFQGVDAAGRVFGKNFGQIVGGEIQKLGAGLGGKIGAAIGSLDKSLVGELAQLAFALLDILGQGIENLISGVVDMVLKAVNGILTTILKGKIFTSLFSSLKNGIGSILNTVTFGGFNALFAARGNSKEVNKLTEKLEKRNEALIQSIDALTKQLEKSGGLVAISTAKQLKAAKEQEIENKRRLLAAQEGYHAAHHSNNKYISDALNERDWAAIDAALGDKRVAHDVWRLWTLSPEDLRKVQGLVEVWDKILHSGKYDKSEYLDSYLAEADALKEIQDKLHEALTQTTFDGFKDSFTSALTDMTSDAQTFADNFEKMMQKAIFNAIIENEFKDDLQKLYDDWVAASESDAELTAEEAARLKEEQKAITDSILARRQTLADSMGWELGSDRQGVSRGIAQASQDSVDALAGQMTAVTMLVDDCRGALGGINEQLGASYAEAVAQRSATEQVRDLQQLSLQQLQAIAKNTGELFQMNARLGSIESNMNDFALRGVKLKS